MANYRVWLTPMNINPNTMPTYYIHQSTNEVNFFHMYWNQQTTDYLFCTPLYLCTLSSEKLKIIDCKTRPSDDGVYYKLSIRIRPPKKLQDNNSKRYIFSSYYILHIYNFPISNKSSFNNYMDPRGQNCHRTQIDHHRIA